MRPPVETLRITAVGRDHLLKLKRQTGIEQWNILCRWALCASLSENSAPPPIQSSFEGGIEINWKVFSGEWSSILAASIVIRARHDGIDTDEDGLATCLKLHVHRGLAYLCSGKDKNLIDGFMSRWTPIL